jgi:hypothetical protein
MLKEIDQKYKSLNGKPLSEKQRQTLLARKKEELRKQENPDFDPRKHRLRHGIRGYREPGEIAHAAGAF